MALREATTRSESGLPPVPHCRAKKMYITLPALGARRRSSGSGGPVRGVAIIWERSAPAAAPDRCFMVWGRHIIMVSVSLRRAGHKHNFKQGREGGGVGVRRRLR